MITKAIIFNLILGLQLFASLGGQSPVTESKPVTQHQDFYLLPITQTTLFPLRDYSIPEPKILAQSFLEYDTYSGKVLASKNSDKKWPMASLAKIMTAIVVLENDSDLEKEFKITKDVLVKSESFEGGVDLVVGETWRVYDLLQMMLIKSSNTAAFAIEKVLENDGIVLVDKMNEKAKELGMEQTTFNDPAGLDDINTISNAEDLGKMIEYSFKHDLIQKILTTQKENIATADMKTMKSLVSTNQLLGVIPDILSGKTGFTDLAKGNMILVVKASPDSKLVSIVLGSDDRFGETKKIIDWAKKAYKWE